MQLDDLAVVVHGDVLRMSARRLKDFAPRAFVGNVANERVDGDGEPEVATVYGLYEDVDRLRRSRGRLRLVGISVI
jgi:hypothetical protein